MILVERPVDVRRHDLSRPRQHVLPHVVGQPVRRVPVERERDHVVTGRHGVHLIQIRLGPRHALLRPIDRRGRGSQLPRRARSPEQQPEQRLHRRDAF